MRTFVKSGLAFSWAMPVFAARQLANVLSPTQAASAFDVVTMAAKAELEKPLETTFEIGDQLQRTAADLAFDLLSPQMLDPRRAMEVATSFFEHAVGALRLTVPGHELAIALAELKNKAQVFVLVQQSSTLMGVPPKTPDFPLPELVSRAYALGDYRALWAVEGLGHDYGGNFLQLGELPPSLLGAEMRSRVEEKSLLMLHAGIGLAFAQELLKNADGDNLAPIVDRILALDGQHSSPGYEGAAVESLGLVARTFHPHLVDGVDQVLRANHPAAVGYFWHGVGRAIYFLPLNFLPGSDWPCFEQARREAPDELARRNAFAGLSWGFTMVNIEAPEVLAQLLVKHHGEELAEDDAFANGVASSIVMRQDTTPGAPLIAAFEDYQPEASDPRLGRLWEELVRVPCQEALAWYHPVLQRHGRLGEVFRYQNLAELVQELS